MALTIRSSVKALLRIPLAGKADSLRKILVIDSPNSLFDGLWKVGFQDFKFEPKSKTVCPSALNIRCLSTTVAVKGEDEEELKKGKSKTQDKKKKLKGRRAVIKWVKHFRLQKKKEYEQMSPQEKIMYKLKKARRKEVRLVAALKKLEPKESSDPTHDPEILTPEEHFYYLKMGHRCKNYVPVGRRGIFGGVILNMHLHWKKHQTVKVIVKTFTPDEVREIATELARLTGGIVLDIYEGNTIIMYRGKNYSQPPTEIMTPKITLSKNKALSKSKYTQALRAVRIFIPRLEKELEVLCQQMEGGGQVNSEQSDKMSHNQRGVAEHIIERVPLTRYIYKRNEAIAEHGIATEELSDFSGTETGDHASDTDFDMASDSEALSDLFETDSEMNSESSGEPDHALYLDNIDAPPSEDEKIFTDIAKDESQMPKDLKEVDGSVDDSCVPELDEVDKLFLRVSSFLKKKK